MQEDQELQVIVQQDKQPTDHEERNTITTSQASVAQSKNKSWWFRMFIYTVFVLCGQSVATLLGRLYYDKGGKSKWMATLVQLAGFPVLLPFYFLSPVKEPATTYKDVQSPSPMSIGAVYIFLGLLIAADCYLYSIGLLYLPVSTYSLICASQLAFNAFFSYILNSQKFTPFVLNALVLLTISSTLLVFNNESKEPTKVSRGKYIIGFLCTIGASAGYGLVLSLTQLTFQKVLRRQTFSTVMDMIIYPNLVATCATLVGFFASGDWRSITHEMVNYELGKVSYVMNLVWTAVSWQIFSIGAIGLIFELSSLFSNAISALGLPVVPIMAVIIFRDKMNGLKVIAMVLAIWGFTSYVYQHYLDDKNSKDGHGIPTKESLNLQQPEEANAQTT